MQQRVPTPYQYLLDVDCKQRIDKAIATGDPVKIANANQYFGNLSETEVVFGQEIWKTDPFKPGVGNWQTSYLCQGRKFKLDPLRYNQGTIEAMLKPKSRPNSISWADCRLPAFYYNQYDGVNNLCLLYRRDIDIFEALKMAGYEFDPRKCQITTYAGYNGNVNANGHIDIEYSFVKGRIYFAYQQVFFDPDDPRNPDNKPSSTAAVMSLGIDPAAAPAPEEKVEGKVEETQTTQPTEGAKTGNVEETPAQEQTPKEEPAPKVEPQPAKRETPVKKGR